jgi:hypothetical protein
MSSKKRPANNEVQVVDYAPLVTLKTTKERTQILFSQIIGRSDIYIETGSSCDDVAPFVGDEVELIFNSDSRKREVRIFDDTFFHGSLIIPANSSSSIKLRFDGESWDEIYRTSVVTNKNKIN